MNNMLSPKVRVREFDLTGIIPSVSTTEVGSVGQFAWGPLEERVLIGSEDELIEVFGKPNDSNFEDWFTSANVLAYGNTLWQVRMGDTTNANTNLQIRNATSANTTGILIKNDDHYENSYSNGQLGSSFGSGEWVAKYPGALGNSLRVSICPSATAYQTNLTGTLSVTAGNTTVTGTGTNFTTQVAPGDLLIINKETVKVATVSNATSLVLEARHVTGAAANTAVRRWEYFSNVDRAPGTSTFAQSVGGSNDEMHVVVVDVTGEFSGIANTVLEVFQFVSKASDAKSSDGSSNYYKEAINRGSRYIRWAAHSAGITNIGTVARSKSFGVPVLPVSTTLVGGRDGANVSDNERLEGFDLFLSPEDVDISILVGGPATQTTTVGVINNIIEKRRDCIGFFSPPRATCVNNVGNEAVDIVNYRNLLPSTSYASLDGAWKYQYDKYNDVYRYVPMNGDVAGLHIQTDLDRDSWWAAAGLNRGQIKNVIKLSWNAKEEDRDQLYKNNINPCVTFKGDGTVLWGQKTLLAKPSAFDRINVRRLFLTLEKAIAKAAKYQLFEFNDETSRAQFRNMVTPYLRDVQGRRGVSGFRVVCDDSNNTPEVIDRNEFVANIFIKPARVAEFITLNFIATRTGVSFEEIAGQQF